VRSEIYGFYANAPFVPSLARKLLRACSSNHGPIINRGVIDKGIVNRGIVDKGIVNRGIVNRGIVNRGIVDKGIIASRWSAKGNAHAPQA
tara:strand:- start:118168 stop:118437 length:270 start_codon:yes stop_codon:yes gene_type:complete